MYLVASSSVCLYLFLVSSTCKLLIVFTLSSNLDSSDKDIGDVDVNNRRIFAYLLNENMIYKNCPTLLACGIEFQKMAIKNEKDQTVMNSIKQDDAVKELLPKVSPSK